MRVCTLGRNSRTSLVNSSLVSDRMCHELLVVVHGVGLQEELSTSLRWRCFHLSLCEGEGILHMTSTFRHLTRGKVHVARRRTLQPGDPSCLASASRAELDPYTSTAMGCETVVHI